MDHKLKIFKEVALTKSFTKASENLFISQPAISKTIKNLEEQYGKAFFLRKGNHISLTPEGLKFLEYTERLLEIYAELNDSFLSDNPSLPSRLKIGASTTIGQYVIPKIAAIIKQDHDQIQLELICGNTTDVQQLVLNGQIDFGIVEGDNHNTRLHYDKFVKDELVLVANSNYKNLKKDSLTLAELETLSFVSRESGSGSKEVIANALEKHDVKPLSVAMVLGSTESIKSYLKYAEEVAFLSVHAISQEVLEGQLRIIEVDGLTIERWFYFVSRQGFQSKIQQKLQQLFLTGYNQK